MSNPSWDERLSRVVLAPQFHSGLTGGGRFVLDIAPARVIQPKGHVLCVQPFAEEMNLSRRVLAAQAVRLATIGWTVSIPDLYGTGDSAGEDEEASADQWRQDLDAFAERLEQPHAATRLVIWGTRLGCVLACDLMARRSRAVHALVLWQPCVSGASIVGPLLKLDQVGAIARAGLARGGRESVPSSADPVQQSIVSVAGYRYRRDLLDELGAMSCFPPPGGGRVCPTLLLGLARQRAAAEPPRWLTELASRWENAAYPVRLEMAESEPFWSSMEPSTPTRAFDLTETFLARL